MKDKKEVAKLAKIINDAEFGVAVYGGRKIGACNMCKQTAFHGAPSIRVAELGYCSVIGSEEFNARSEKFSSDVEKYTSIASRYADQFGGRLVVEKSASDNNVYSSEDWKRVPKYIHFRSSRDIDRVMMNVLKFTPAGVEHHERCVVRIVFA